MELYEANRILRTVRSAFAVDGYKPPSSAESDGLLLLLGRLDGEKYLLPKIKHTATLDRGSAAFDRNNKFIMFFRALQTVKNAVINDPVTAMTLMLLHKAVCGDFDPDAGKLRIADAHTDGNAHTDPKYIAGSMKSVFAKINETAGAPQTSKDEFAGYLSYYMREFIILHPFTRGSELTVRIFTMLLCKLKGFSLDYSRSTVSALKTAETAALAADDVAPLYKLFSECLSYDHKTSTSSPPKTKREAARDLFRPSRTVSDERPRTATVKKQKQQSDDDVLKRAIRLQQKISRLNEQLNELIRPLENTDDDRSL